MINIILLHTLILLIWFKTDAFIVYSKLFKVNKFLKVKEWEIFKNTQDITVTYHQYLRFKYTDNFFIKLITCPICFSIWLTIFSCILVGFINLPIICVSTIFTYYLIVKLM